MSSKWPRVSKQRPCPKCGKPDRCTIAPDGSAGRCFRNGETWRDGNAPRNRSAHVGAAHRPKSKPDSTDWKAAAERFAAAISPEQLTALADATGIHAAAWQGLSPGWATASELKAMRAGGAGWAENPPDGAYTFPERAGDGRIIGISLRAPDGRKGFPAGAKRGLIVPADLHKRQGSVLIVEGASDVAACKAVGLLAVGRPSNRGGSDDLAAMLDSMPALVLGENDGKPGGAWPGRDGAKAVAQRMAAAWSEPIRWALPPAESKDVRDWLKARVAAGLDTSSVDAMNAAGAEFLAAVEVAAKIAKPERRSQADALVDLAHSTYRLGMSIDREAFAVPVDGPAVAMMFRGGGSALRAALAKQYRAVTGKTPSASALADALTALEGMAQDSDPEPVALRLAAHDGGVVVDLGDKSGRAIVVNPGGWAVEAVSPVLFRRTALTLPLPEPSAATAAELAELRGLLNVDDDTWPLVVGYLVAAYMPDLPHPVVMLGGEQGTGKSTAARLLIGLIDPSAAPLRSEPRDAEQWAVAASGSWAVCIDNVSHITGWLSDAICKAVTGDGLVRRKLYTDSDLAVLSFRRCIMLTSIDAGALRGDLGDRLLLADLERIPESQRRTEAELHAAFGQAGPRLLGALLSAVSQTLAELPAVKLATMPRMADFARVLAAVDVACPELTGGRAFNLFAGQRNRIAGEVVEADPVAAAVVKVMETRDSWVGTAAELLAALPSGQHPPRGWPATARALAGRLKRVAPALRHVGIVHTPPAEADKSRTHRLEKGRIQPPQPPEPPKNGVSTAPAGIFDGRYAGGTESTTAQPPTDRPSENGVFGPDTVDSGRLGGMGGTNPVTSGDGRERGEL